MGSIQLIESFNDHRNIVTLIFYSFFFLLIYKSFGVNDGCRIIMVSLSLMIFPFIPASNIFFPVGFVVAERVLYIPSFGYCMLIAHGFVMLSYHFDQSNKKFIEKYVIHIVFIILIIVHSSRTIMRNEDWKNEHNIFASGIRVNSNNAKLLNNLGHVYEIEKQYYKSLDLFLEAVHRQPDDIGAYSNVARVYNHIGRIDLSEKYYSKAKSILMSELRQTSINDQQQRFARIAPVHLNIFLNLANLISRNQSRLQEADDLYRQVIRMRPDYVEAYINRGDILLRMNRTNEANNIYRTALNYDHNNADIYYNLGVVAIHSNRFDMAIDYFQKAIEINSKHLVSFFCPMKIYVCI